MIAWGVDREGAKEIYLFIFKLENFFDFSRAHLICFVWYTIYDLKCLVSCMREVLYLHYHA